MDQDCIDGYQSWNNSAENTTYSCIKVSEQKTTALIQILSSIQSLICIGIVILSSISIIALRRGKTMAFQIKLPLMIVGITDLMTGVVVVMFLSARLVNLNVSVIPCLFGLVMMRFGVNATFQTLTALSVDRCLCLYADLRYFSRVTKKVTILIYSVVIFSSMCVVLLKFALDMKSFTGCRLSYVYRKSNREFPFVLENIIRLINLVSFILTIRKVNQIVTRNKNLGVKNFNKSFFSSSIKCAAIALTYQLMYLPHGLKDIVSFVRPDLTEHGSFMHTVASFSLTLNAFVNPFLYGLRFKECRCEVKKMLCFWNKKLVNNIEVQQKQLHAPFLIMNNYGLNPS